jgi:POT family proton-dependent oligopeptide transporter
MSLGAFAVALAFLMLAGVDASAAGHAHWLWLALFFLVFTAGELFVLPIGLGLFARLAPARHAATTIAAWYLASFTGNLLAGALGTLWSAMGHAAFFGAMAGVAAIAGVLLRLLDPLVARAESTQGSLSDQRSSSASILD